MVQKLLQKKLKSFFDEKPSQIVLRNTRYIFPNILNWKLELPREIFADVAKGKAEAVSVGLATEIHVT